MNFFVALLATVPMILGLFSFTLKSFAFAPNIRTVTCSGFGFKRVLTFWIVYSIGTYLRAGVAFLRSDRFFVFTAILLTEYQFRGQSDEDNARYVINNRHRFGRLRQIVPDLPGS